MSASGTPRLALFALLLLSLIWGYNWVVMKQVIQYVDPFDFSAIRTVLGAATLFIVLIVLRKPLSPVAARQMLLLGVLQTGAFTALIQWALVAGGAAGLGHQRFEVGDPIHVTRDLREHERPVYVHEVCPELVDLRNAQAGEVACLDCFLIHPIGACDR